MNPLNYKNMLFSLSFLLGFGKAVSAQSDTTYVEIDSKYGKSQSTYILTNSGPDRYKALANFENVESNETYQSSVDYFTNQHIPFEKYKVNLPSNEWITLHLYKNAYYVYDECDGYHHHQVSMTDSSYINWTGEGAYLSKLVSFSKTDHSTFRLEYTDDYSNTEIIIHLIDKKKGIAVFEQTNRNSSNENPEKSYTLMIAADKLSGVPIFVNQCSLNKRSEFEFDEIDFPSLIKKKSN